MTPEQEDQVRRALTEVARSEPVPPVPEQVERRLDEVLAELQVERSARSARSREKAAGEGARDGSDSSPTAAPPDDPGSRDEADELAVRRGRRRRDWLVAAATVVVIGAGFALTHERSGGGSDAGGSAADRSVAESRTAPSTGSSPSGAAPTPPGPSLTAGLPRLRSSSLARDVRTAIREDTLLGEGKTQRNQADGGEAQSGSGPRCRTPQVPTGGRRFDVLLDGKPATLVLAAPRDGTRVARVYDCDDARRAVARTSVAVPR